MTDTPDLPAFVGASSVPAKPKLKPPVQSALRWAVRTFGGMTPVIDPDWEPPAVDPGAIAEIRANIAQYERYLEPVSDMTWLVARVDALLKHGFVQDANPATQQLIIGDWVVQLRHFPQWVIANAAAELLGGRVRITLQAMAQACRAELGDAQLQLAALRRLADPLEQERARQRDRDRRR